MHVRTTCSCTHAREILNTGAALRQRSVATLGLACSEAMQVEGSARWEAAASLEKQLLQMMISEGVGEGGSTGVVQVGTWSSGLLRDCVSYLSVCKRSYWYFRLGSEGVQKRVDAIRLLLGEVGI